MRKITSECVGCPDGCRHCRLERVEVLACDICGSEGEELYSIDGTGEYCGECAKKIMTGYCGPLELAETLGVDCGKVSI